MIKEEKSSIDKIVNQLSLINDINKDIAISKEINSKLMVRQYEHLKKQYVKKLYKMLAENYQIPIPTIAKKEAA